MMRVMVWGHDWGRELELTDSQETQLKQLLGVTDDEIDACGVTVRID